MFSKIWQILRRWVQRLLGRERTPQPQAPPPSPRVETPLSDAEYEAIFLQLLDGVHQGWSRGQVKGFLLAKRINESYLVAWLQRFGERLQASPLDHAELIHRLVLLGNLDIGELSAVARKMGQELLAQLPPPPEPPPDEWPVIEAIFTGNGLGSAGEKQESQQNERTEATSSEANEEAEKWFDQGNQKFMEGDFLGAIASYDRAIELQPDIPEVYYNRGTALSGLGRYEEAIASYERAIKLKPNYPNAYYNRSVALYNLGRYEEAITSYERAIKLKPNYPNAYNNRGNALQSLGRYEEAITSYERAIELKPNYPDAYYSRGIALYNLGRYEKAITSCDRAIELQPNYPEAWLNRGSALHHLGLYGAATASYERAIKLKPNYPEAYNNRGFALSDLERYEEAIASYDRAIELQPNFPEAWLGRGIAAGWSIDSDPLLTSMSAIARENPRLFNQRGYHGKLASYEAGLEKCPQDTHPEGWGFLHHAIGNAHYYRARRELQPASYYLKAESSYNRALITLTKDAFPERHLKVLQDLIKVLFRLRRRAEAAEILRRGWDLLRELVTQYQQTRGEKAAQQLQLKFASFQQFTVDLLCQQGKFVEAWEVAEEGKNACLTWLLPGGNEEASPKYADIQPLLNSATAAIYWHTSPVSLTTFIIRANSDTPTVIEEQVAETNAEEPEGIRRLQQLENWLQEWDQDYRNAGKEKDDKTEAQQWRAQLADRLNVLADILNIPKILAKLKPDNAIKQIILFPHQDLHRLPLEALFPDDFTLIRLPSVQMGLHLQQNCRNTGNTPSTTPTLLCVEPPKSKAPIPYAEMESTAVCHLFDSHTAIASHEATCEKLAQELTSGYRVFHFSGHGKHEPLHPKLSQLDLSGSEKLKLEEICGLCLQGYDLVTLSACETAIAANQTITTEYVGLVSAFLYGAGVAHVLSTLWKVEAEATAIVTLKFYTLFLAGEPAPSAIAIANRWLRDATWNHVMQFYQELRVLLGADALELDQALELAIDTILEKELTAQPFINPYYWSAFVLTGLPIQS